MYNDFDILESSLFDDDFDDEYMTEASKKGGLFGSNKKKSNDLFAGMGKKKKSGGISEEQAKLLGVIAGGLALGALLIILIRKIRNELKAKKNLMDKGGFSKEDAKKLKKLYGSYSYADKDAAAKDNLAIQNTIDVCEKTVKSSMKDLKSRRTELKQAVKKANYENDTAVMKKLKDIASLIKKPLGLLKKAKNTVVGLAKKLSIPVDKIQAAAEKIKGGVKKQAANQAGGESTVGESAYEDDDDDAYTEKALDYLESLEYDMEFSDLFESVMSDATDYYLSESADDDEFGFNFSEIL